jgi:hypothetical protein
LIAGDEKRAQQEQVTLLLDSGELRNVDLTAVAGVRFTDTKLQAQFKDYLAALVAAPPPVTMTSTLRRTSSAANAGRRSSFPSANRRSMTMFFPST